MVAILFSCNKESISETEQFQEAITTDSTTELDLRAPTFPDPIIIGDENTGCVANIIFLAEGFTESQMSEFRDLCDIAKQAILDVAPYSYVTDHLNFYRVESPSRTSGIRSIAFTSRCGTPTGSNTSSRTAWSVYSNRVGLERYVGMKSAMRDYLEDLYGGYATGDYAYTIIIANTTEYFGGAEFPGVTEYNTIANPKVSNMIVSKYLSGAYFKFLVRHEFGHSFGNMDDEYIDPDTNCAINSYEPWFLPPTPKLNIRTYASSGWVEGGRYVPTGYWREWENSIMNNDYFSTTLSPIQEAIVKKRLSVAIGCH